MAPALLDALSDRLSAVGRSPAGSRVRTAWRGRLSGPPLRLIATFVVLIGVLRLALHSNAPPAGVIVFGAIVGLLYAMVAFGLILIYRANRIINFAQAEMGAVPAVMSVLLIKVHHINYLVALVIAIGSGIVAGAVVEFLVIRRFFRAPRLVLSVATIGLAEIFGLLQFYLPKWLGGRFIVDPKPPKTPFSGLHLNVYPIRFDGNSLVVIFAAVLVVVGLTLFFRFTDIGIAVRASAENADRASLLGISVKRLSTYVWIIASVLSTLGVFLRIPVIGLPIGADIGPFVLLYALSAAVIARMESFSVALVAGVCIGIIEQSLYYFSRDPSIASAVMLPILLVAMLLQRRRQSRGQDTGLATWSMGREFRPIPPELRNVLEVAWLRAGLAVVVLGLAVGLPYLVGLEQQILLSTIVVYGMVAVSLVILMGWAGQISLGQWGFAGIGALVAGGLAAHLHTDFFITLAAAGVTGAVVAVVIGLPALRIQGLYLAVTTIAFAIAVQVYLLSPNYFAGILPNNSQSIYRPLLYSRYSLNGPRAFYYFCLVMLALALLSARALRRSRAGRVMIAARDNERGAQSYGVTISAARLAAFAISGFWAAMAGALFAYGQKVVETQAFDFGISELLLVIVVIGGTTSLPGAMLGTAYIGVLMYGGFSPQIQALASGVGVLFLLWLFPGGLAQIAYDWVRDPLLRAIAARRKIVVPSLVADPRVEKEQEAAQAKALTTAMATSLSLGGAPAGNGAGNGHPKAPARPGEIPEAIRCPVCSRVIPIEAVAFHEHFETAEAPTQ
ncbi:MAG TPA: ABC transporter permease [Acidimicrobiales bacterium]|nr:ABC transporter permease [Acidimicrobiales bacterium]